MWQFYSRPFFGIVHRQKKRTGFNILKRYVILALQHLLHISTSSVDVCADLDPFPPTPPKRLIVKKWTRKWDLWNWIVSMPNILRSPGDVNISLPYTFKLFEMLLLKHLWYMITKSLNEICVNGLFKNGSTLLQNVFAQFLYIKVGFAEKISNL